MAREPTPERAAALTAIEHGLDAADTQQWRTFIAQNEDGPRRQALATLDRLIEAIDAYPLERRAAWVVAVCRARWDVGALEQLPFPLLDRLVIPELRRGYAATLPEYARWLGQTMHSSALGLYGARCVTEIRVLGGQGESRGGGSGSPFEAEMVE